MKRLVLVLAVVAISTSRFALAEPLTVAVSPDIPPYVMKQATTGLEVDIIRGALPDREITFLQLPYSGLQTAVADGKAPVAAGVREIGTTPPGVHFSDEFVYFKNTAATKAADKLAIGSVADLAGHPVYAWEDAAVELGPAFEKLFGPQGTARANYHEVANQQNQVAEFWKTPGAIVVIDKTILDYFSQEAGHPRDAYVDHDLFPEVTGFRLAFADPALRDAFNAGLKKLCATGAYDRILATYGVTLPRSICAGQAK